MLGYPLIKSTAKGTLAAVAAVLLVAVVPFDPDVVNAPLVRDDNAGARGKTVAGQIGAKGLRFAEASFLSDGVRCHARTASWTRS